MKKNKIDPDILIIDLAELYPEVVNFLIYEYQFHCIGCFVSQFETLRQGAEVHGIVGNDFNEMLTRINKLAEESESEKVKTAVNKTHKRESSAD